MNKKPIPSLEKESSPKERFERFVSALVRTPKKQVDEKQRELEMERKAEKDLQDGV